ncbi:uncharacterized protein LOC111042164 [Myzus persicae]|uniref:uncharacterized protein LOC111042164 n=1 Tax=Myzus persicae TaxID=13164 RepID=UPI000B93807F|nr:uncharacterized protein LOC111042164 [Myzus persicae]
MSRQITSPRVSRRNKRKLQIDYLDETSLERDVDLCEDLSIDVTNDSQTSLEGHRDLFGELIPEECVSDKVVKNKSIRKTPGSKKKKFPHEELLFDTPTRPKRVFIPTPKLLKSMFEGHKELYSLMGASARSSNVSIASTDSLNVSGVERLQDSPVTTVRNESKKNIKENDNEQKWSKVLEGKLKYSKNFVYVKLVFILIFHFKDDLYKPNDIENILSDQLCKELKKVVSPVPDDQIDELNVPIPIKILRNHLTPDVIVNTIPKDVYGQIAKIEYRFNFNFQAKKRFRMLLFPSDKDLNNIDEISDLSTQTKDNDSRTMSINSMTIREPEVFLDDDFRVQSIACTGIIKSEVNILKTCIEKLGKFIFHTKVKRTTTYLITKSVSNQSLDIVFAMAYGCYIVSEDWVLKSYAIGRWLSHQKYMIPELSEPVKDFQIRRHRVSGSKLKFNIFDKAGQIYVSNSCESPAELLRQLVHACGGHCTSEESKADIVIGATIQFRHNTHEKWIFDCITQGILLNKYQYTYVNSSE